MERRQSNRRPAREHESNYAFPTNPFHERSRTVLLTRFSGRPHQMTAKKHRPDRSRKGTAASAGRPGTYRRGAPRPYPDHHPNQPNPLNLGSGAGTGNRSGSSSGSLCADGSPFGGPMLRRSVSSSGGSDAPKAAAGNPGGGETLGDGLGRVVEELGGAVVAAEVARC